MPFALSSSPRQTRPILLLVGAWFRLTTSSPAQAKPPPTLPPESRQFDFWLGDWGVTAPDGKLAGTSKIEPIANGAGLLENWSDADGSSGKSLSVYNAARKPWQQFWVGTGGGVLELAGAIVKGNMVLTGGHDVRGRHLTERITWMPKADGTVRQHWEQSTDGGKFWQTVSMACISTKPASR